MYLVFPAMMMHVLTRSGVCGASTEPTLPTVLAMLVRELREVVGNTSMATTYIENTP